MVWLFPAVLLIYFIYVRSRARLSVLKTIVADLAMTVLLTVALLLSLFTWSLVYLAIPAISGPSNATPVTLIVVLFMAALISTVFQCALLRGFRPRVTRLGFWLLLVANAFCLSLASYRTYLFALAHPPLA